MPRKYSGKALRAARIESGTTLDQMAERLGTTPRTICGYQSEKSIPSVHRLVALADAMGVDMNRFFVEVEGEDK